MASPISNDQQQPSTVQEVVMALLASIEIIPILVGGANGHPQIHLKATQLVVACDQLRTDPSTYFDHLSCLTGLDLGPNKQTGLQEVQVVYTLYSIPHQHWCSLYVTTERDGAVLVPSVGSIWPGAWCHEREAFDLVGINFSNHPDLRRILLPADWEGHPLRKDYQQQAQYHGLELQYRKED